MGIRDKPFNEKELLIDVVHPKKTLNSGISPIGQSADLQVTHGDSGKVPGILPRWAGEKSFDTLKADKIYEWAIPWTTRRSSCCLSSSRLWRWQQWRWSGSAASWRGTGRSEGRSSRRGRFPWRLPEVCRGLAPWQLPAWKWPPSEGGPFAASVQAFSAPWCLWWW